MPSINICFNPFYFPKSTFVNLTCVGQLTFIIFKFETEYPARSGRPQNCYYCNYILESPTHTSRPTHTIPPNSPQERHKGKIARLAFAFYSSPKIMKIKSIMERHCLSQHSDPITPIPSSRITNKHIFTSSFTIYETISYQANSLSLLISLPPCFICYLYHCLCNTELVTNIIIDSLSVTLSFSCKTTLSLLLAWICMKNKR